MIFILMHQIYTFRILKSMIYSHPIELCRNDNNYLFYIIIIVARELNRLLFPNSPSWRKAI